MGKSRTISVYTQPYRDRTSNHTTIVNLIRELAVNPKTQKYTSSTNFHLNAKCNICHYYKHIQKHKIPFAMNAEYNAKE